MAINVIALSLSKQFTKDTADGFGAVKGAACQVTGFAHDAENKQTVIELGWENNEGESQTGYFVVPDGADGPAGTSIASVTINSDVHLIVTDTKGNTFDAGRIPISDNATVVVGGAGDYSNPGVKNGIGGIKTGTVFNKTPITEVLDKLFEPPYTKPTISIGLSSRNLYDKNGTLPETITITANVGKTSDKIKYVSAYAGSTLIEKKETGVEAGGTFKFTFAVPANFSTTTFKVECNDGTNTVSTTSVVTLVALSYYGTIENGTEINETNIKALTSDLKAKVGSTYTYNATYGRFVHALPKALGTISSVKDLVNNFTYTESTTITSMTINGEAYWVAYLTDPMGFDGVKITFA